MPPPIDNSSSGETTAPGETKTATQYQYLNRQPHQLLDAVRQGRAQKEDHQHGDGESCRVRKSKCHRDDDNNNNNKPERREKKDDEDRISSSDEIVQKNNVRRGLRVVPIIFLVRQQSKDETDATNSANPPHEIPNKLQTAEGEELTLLPDFYAGSSSMQRSGSSNPPTGPPPTPTQQNQNSLSIDPQIRSTADLQACLCNLRRQCMSKNVVMKDKAFLICVYYQEKGVVDNQIHRFQQIPYMNITHSTTGTVFEPITSDYMAGGDLIATYLSPWITVKNYADPTLMILRLEQLLDFWFESKGSSVDIVGEVLVQTDGDVMDGTEINPLGSDVTFTKQSTEYFHLSALLMDRPPCESSIPGSLAVSIRDGNSIVFACTCNETNSCRDLSFDLPDESSTASVRICIIPQQGNDETADIVRITQLTLDKEGPCGFPFDVVSDGVVSPLATIEEVVGDDNPSVIMLVATIELLAPQVLNPSPITVYGAVEVKQPDSQLKELPFGTLRYAAVVDDPVDEPTSYECITDPSPLSPNELVKLCLLARPQTYEFINGSVDVLVAQNSYNKLIVENGVAEGTGTNITFKNGTLMVIEILLDDAVFESSLNYVEFNSYAGLEKDSFSSDVTSYLRLPLYTEPSNMPSASPSLSHRPTFNGPTFEPTQSNEPTEEQAIRLEYCPCDSNRKCVGVESVTLTQYERNIRICFKALPTTSQVVGTPIVSSSSSEFPIPFTTLLDSDMSGGLITGEAPDELFESESSVGSAIEVWGMFDVVEGGRNAILGLSVVYEIASVESSAYCSSSTAQLQACACQCDDNNNCVDGLIQTSSSRNVRICVFSSPTGTKIGNVDGFFLQNMSGDENAADSFQIVIQNGQPKNSITPGRPATLRVITTSLKDAFFSDLNGSRIVKARGSGTVLPDNGGYGQNVEIHEVKLTIMQELTPEPSRSPSSAPTTVPPTPDPSNAPTPQPTPLPTTVQPTPGPTSVPSNPPTPMPTPSPTNAPKDPPSPGPTNQPSRSPTPNPSIPPPPGPTPNPTRPPSPGPTPNPTRLPTPRPTNRPSPPPTTNPSIPPTPVPTNPPSPPPTPNPSRPPSPGPTPNPTRLPTPRPTNRPSPPPTPNPSRQPTSVPTPNPSMPPSPEPTNPPSRSPTPNPSRQPSPEPTNSPSRSPTTTPSKTPTSEPTNSPSRSPTTTPSKTPTSEPTTSPSRSPTTNPSLHPSFQPSDKPSTYPSLFPSTNKAPSTQPSLTPSESAQPSSGP
eukprot:scaffold2502_cov80-Skeletonema_dohrnii-CCMP3373.AAC.1